MADVPTPRAWRGWRAWGVARRLAGGVREPAFRALVQQVDGGPLHAGPSPLLLPDGEAAFTRMRAAIAGARDEVLLETYILRDDRLGHTMQTTLMEAARRGVRVSVLADALGSFRTADRFWVTLEAAGVQVRHFHRFWYHPFDAVRRDHRKLLVIDRAIAFTGGMNIGNEYGSNPTVQAEAWRDSFVETAGSVARELAAVFAEGWDRAGGAALPGLAYVSWNERVAPAPDVARPPRARALQERLQWQLQARRARREDRRRGRRVRRQAELAGDDVPAVLVMDPRPGRGQREMLTVLAALVGGARERLWVTTPYFAPPSRALGLLTAAAQRGIDVRLLLPGERTDVPIARHAAHGAYATLLAQGVRIYEYQRAMLHAKTLVVDGFASVIGSSNLDFRSFWLNAECNLLVFDDRFGAELEASFVADLAASTEITRDRWRQRPVGHRVGDIVARAMRWAL